MNARRTIVAALLGLGLACVSEARVEEHLEEANYCESAEECVAVYPGCPLGCSAWVNEAEVEEAEALIERYHGQHPERCAYDCIGEGPPRCESGQCVADPLE